MVLLILWFLALTEASLDACLPPITSQPTSTTSLGTVIGTASVSSTYLTIGVINQFGAPLSLSLASDAGFPCPSGDPTPAALPDLASTQYLFPTGWAGSIILGRNLDPDGSKIEGSFTASPDIDVSYVDGYLLHTQMIPHC